MKKTAATAGGLGATGGAYELYTQSWEWWADALPAITVVGYAAVFAGGFALWLLWRRVKALETRS